MIKNKTATHFPCRLVVIYSSQMRHNDLIPPLPSFEITVIIA